MDVSYKRLWKLLIDNTDTLVKICGALNCRIEDIMEVVPDEK